MQEISGSGKEANLDGEIADAVAHRLPALPNTERQTLSTAVS
jgi:hypothetical protein